MTLRKGRPYDPAWDAWQPRRRWPGILISALVIAGFIGSLAFKYTSKPATAPTVIAPGSLSQVKIPYFPPVSPNSAELQQSTGTKAVSNVAYQANGKLMVWYFQCRCVTNFGVIVHSANGSVIDVPVNSTGKTIIAAPAFYPKGKLLVSIIADGQWTVSLIDPSKLPNQTLPLDFLSSGQSVLGPFTGPRLDASVGFLGAIGNRFTMSVTDGSLATPRLLMFESQAFSKTLVQTKLPKKYWLIVNGNGFWQLKVKQ